MDALARELQGVPRAAPHSFVCDSKDAESSLESRAEER